MLRDIGLLLLALGEIPGLSFLKNFGRKLSNTGRSIDRIHNRANSVKKRVKKYTDRDDAA